LKDKAPDALVLGLRAEVPVRRERVNLRDREYEAKYVKSGRTDEMFAKEQERYDIDTALTMADEVLVNNTDQQYALDDELAVILKRHKLIADETAA
jgi:hypothetical protein